MEITIDKAIKMLIAKEQCIERKTSGTNSNCYYDCDNCSLCYEQGNMGEQKELLKYVVETMRKYQQLENFARWVAKEIIDEDMWELNHLSFAEIACRKLVQLGVMQESDGEYTYEVVEDGET